MIINCYEEGQFNDVSDMRSLNIVDLGNERKKFGDTMDLLNYIMTESDWFQLKSILNEIDVIKIANDIVNRAMNKLLSLEGKDSRGRQQATYKAIGRRIAALRGNGLVGFDKIGTTPVGHKSIKDCFQKK